MDINSLEIKESSVNESAFWHTNMELYYGYQAGEVVEVEHESNKYWLATIIYSFKHLVLLKWAGNYGEFWVDTSLQNLSTNSGTVFNEFNGPKRLFPPGYHLQSQLKSQFTLERPSKVLVKPSLYNPANDPYAEIKTVDDLLTHEVSNDNDAFEKQSSVSGNEPASLVMAKCKTKIAYGQEDVDELEAALQSLNEIDTDGGQTTRNETPDGFNATQFESNKNFSADSEQVKNFNNIDIKSEHETDKPVVMETTQEKQEPQKSMEASSLTESRLTTEDTTPNGAQVVESEVNHEAALEVCKSLQDSAMTRGRYMGLEENKQSVYFLKPKQFFDLGGANHERVFVQGTLLEVCHTHESSSGLELSHWFAIVLKNIGGRLTLRWFLCDEPKFKQGRLELKSCHSDFIQEEDEGDQKGDESKSEEASELKTKTKINVNEITFSMHFCNPCIYSISHAKSTQTRSYKLPSKLKAFIQDIKNPEELAILERAQMDFVFDYRRMNLDKDRPIIDHILSTVRWMTPQYVNLSFAAKDKDSRREILFSTPTTTKLYRGYVMRELEAGVFEVHSESTSDNSEIIKFVYPYDSSYSILPTSWAVNNQDCLSLNASRNPSPTLQGKPPTDENVETHTTTITDTTVKEEVATDQVDQSQLVQQKSIKEETLENKVSVPFQHVSPLTLLCEIARTNELPESEQNNIHFDELEPSCWSRLWRARELEATKFHCSLDLSSMETFYRQFKVMNQLELVHPWSGEFTICVGRIRKVVYPLLWIQISMDSFTVLPFNSTDIYPRRWCKVNNHPCLVLLPPRKRLNPSSSQQDNKKRKRIKNCDDLEQEQSIDFYDTLYEKEHFDLRAMGDKSLDMDYVLNEKSLYIRIYFNHKCFTGPSLSKGKICSLPQYVGPGPLRLVMEEVVTKVISVAYVPPRILNDLSSKSFEELLIARNLTNTVPMEFKAKYQKRVHRENIPVCLNPDDVTLYCECICEHLKCCYNLFGPNLYDGDDCPGHCRALTKSNKFMKRATYYREKARLGEFLTDNGGAKKLNNNSSSVTSRASYAGRNSSESTSSSISRSEQVNSRASSAGDEVPVKELKENLVALEELENEEEGGDPKDESNVKSIKQNNDYPPESAIKEDVEAELGVDKILHSTEQVQNVPNFQIPRRASSEFYIFDSVKLFTERWSVDEVAVALDCCDLGKFRSYMHSEGVDGQALLLLDKAAIREHFQQQPKSDYSPEEVGKLCRFVEYLKTKVETNP